MKPFALSVCLVAAAALAQQARVNFRDQDFSLAEFEVFNAEFRGAEIDFDGSGSPLVIQSGSNGLTVRGRTAEGVAARGPDRRYFLQTATVTGSAEIVAARPEGPVTLRSETVRLSGTPTETRVEMPQAVRILSESRGAAGYNQTLEVSGASGVATLGAAGLQTGSLQGPVEFSMRRTAEVAGAATQVTTIQGRADTLELSLVGPERTLVASGNVTLEGESPVYSGTLEAARVVVSLDAQMQPVSVQVTGTPARARLREIGSGS